MKKSLLLVLAVPALLLTSCGGGVDVNGYISNGTSITEQTKQDVQHVEEAQKQAAEEIINKGVNVKGRTIYDASADTYGGRTSERMDLTLDITLGVTTPSVSVNLNGNVSASQSGQSASGDAKGVSEASKASGEWIIAQDYLTITVNGQSQTEQQYLFNGRRTKVDTFYHSLVDEIYSWEFDFDFETVREAFSQYGLADLVDNIAISGNPKTGTFEIGLTKEYVTTIIGGTLKFNKYRFAYKDFLVKEYTYRLEASGTTVYGSSLVIMEEDYVFTYLQ